MTTTIRLATLSDVAEAVSLSQVTQAEHSDRLPSEFIAEDPPVAAALYPNIIKGKIDGAVFVAVAEEKIVGHVGYYISKVPAPGQRHHLAATLLDLSIAPNVRRTGIGRRLVQHALKDMENRKVTRVDAQVWTGNTASEGLFEHLEFTNVFREFRLHVKESNPGPPIAMRRPALGFLGLFIIVVVLAALAFASG